MRPSILGRSPTALKELISFLKYHCSLRKTDLAPFFFRCPQVLDGDTADFQAKIDYVSELGGTSKMLRSFPKFLTFPLESHIRPRTEFLRAMAVDPLTLGLPFLVSSPDSELAAAAKMKEDVLKKFVVAFIDMWSNKLAEEKMSLQTQQQEMQEEKHSPTPPPIPSQHSRVGDSRNRQRDLWRNNFCEDIDNWF